MMGHPYSQGWRAIMQAGRVRRNRRIVLTLAAVAVIAFFPVVAWLA